MIVCKKEYVIQMVMEDLNDELFMVAKLRTKESDGREGIGIILICGYMPPGKNHEIDLNDALNKIKGVARRFDGAPLMIFGDFNLDREAFTIRVKGSLGMEYLYHHSED